MIIISYLYVCCQALEKIIQDVETTSQREEGLQRQITKLNKELSELKKMYRLVISQILLNLNKCLKHFNSQK